MNKKANWWLDLVLFAGFITASFLDTTGIEMHQWLGVAGGALVLYHLAAHWGWVQALSQRLFDKVSTRVKLYYIIDAVM